MANGRWVLVVGIEDCAQARIPCASEEEARQARELLMRAAMEEGPRGKMPFVNVTGSASVAARDLRYVYIEQE